MILVKNCDSKGNKHLPVKKLDINEREELCNQLTYKK